MACPKKSASKKRKRLPSINPFLHFLKRMWKNHKGCKRSVVLKSAVQKWRCMSQAEKKPFYEAACRAQRMHRKLRKSGKQKPKCSKPKRKSAKPKRRCPRPKKLCPKPSMNPQPCPPNPQQ